MKLLLTAVRLFLVMTIVTGIAYPLLITGVGQLFWPSQAGGSLLFAKNGDVIGSELIAQKFTKDSYFWARPSGCDYNAAASSGSNKGPSSADLKKTYDETDKQYGQEMIFASGSGLDPHISPATAHAQIGRVATARKLSAAQRTQLVVLVDGFVEKRTLGILGEERVNVLKLNVEIDRLFP